jgi:hypothetical protein
VGTQELENATQRFFAYGTSVKARGSRYGIFRRPAILRPSHIVKNRRSLTTTPTGPTGQRADLHATRRGGARREVSARVTLVSRGGAGERTLEGWALNVSRGGVRVILEEKVELGADFEVSMVDGTALSEPPKVRPGRIVWVQEEPDGVVAGVEFRDEP